MIFIVGVDKLVIVTSLSRRNLGVRVSSPMRFKFSGSIMVLHFTFNEGIYEFESRSENHFILEIYAHLLSIERYR